MNRSGVEECPIDIQISRGAHLQPLKLSYLWSDFHETWMAASIGKFWVISYKKKRFNRGAHLKPLKIETFLFMARFSWNLEFSIYR